MKRKKLFRNAAISFLLIMVVLMATAFVDRYYYVDKKLLAIDSIISNYYVGDVNTENQKEGIYKGFVAGVGDVYTTYYTADEYASFKEKSSGVYAGIGVQMTIDTIDNTILIVEVFEGSPAEQVGIKPQDKIVKAAGKTVTGDDFNTLPNVIKGKPDTTVDVSIYRSSEDKTYDFTVTRQNVTYPTIESKTVENDLGYIKISQFEEVTYTQFKEALTNLEKEGVKGLIIDVRDNPGGLLNITEKIADEFLSEGIIVSTRTKDDEAEEYTASEDATDLPVVILVNGNSASASEVLAGALKDHGRAVLVGETTFGKGVVQSVIPLTDGSAIKVTTAKYFTPSGVCIQGIGIEPDYTVTLPTELLTRSKLTESEDTQLQKAIEVLKEQIS